MTAHHSIIPLAWDSAFFGFPTGRLVGTGLLAEDLRELLVQARGQGWRLLYWFVSPEDVVSGEAAQALGLHPADDKRVYARALPARLPVVPAAVRRISGPTASPELTALAVQSGEYSRFRTDPHFAPGQFEQLYAQWLAKALANGMVLAYQPGASQGAQGLLTLEEQGAELAIGLVAVDGQWRRRGIGQALLAGAYRQARAAGFRALRVTTQGANQAACRFYEQAGFALVERQLVFHLWLPEQQ
ncbi:GNAT family N-acetyltransferase [Hymenobacter aquaticus]|uniref:GNAT family N-acetyltransferase n=1 Tax=Hymenobacter aquaticus TaxID=1867101 RepID=A0A4Z0Q8V2_9BACT|nr:GNAT family N-acetyltransferase [Hymenobacter aquaticus]TGE25613.1 GNAT family N-acetyltransferase [Hymenobacter aquaticus]